MGILTPYQKTDAVKEAIKQLQILDEIRNPDGGAVYFVTNFLFIFETRENRGIGWKPFALWPRQIEYINFLEQAYREQWPEVVVEKCRDMGASLLTMAWVVYHWLFDQHFSAIIGTRKEDLVKNMPGHDTLFAKIRDYLEKLPDWLMPKGFNADIHFMKMSLFNPANGNTIVGDSCTPDFGVGPRASVIVRDESARWPIDTSQNTRYTAQLNIDVSTVNGLNHFWQQAMAADKYGRRFIFDWTDNPNFTLEWYEAEKKLATDKGQLHIFRREVERNYRASVEGQIYPNIARVNRPKDDEPDYVYRSDWPLFCIWDFGWTDMGYLGFWQRDPDTGDWYAIDEVYNSQVSIEWYVPFVPGKVVTSSPYAYSPEHLDKIAEHRRWRGEVYHFGDPTGSQRTAAQGVSVFDVLRAYGIKPKCKAGWNNMVLRQEKTSALLLRLSIGRKCEYLIDSFTQYVVPERNPNSQATTAQPKGVHKWSHAVSAVEALAISEPPLQNTLTVTTTANRRIDRFAVR